MRHKRLKTSAVLLLGLGLTALQAQTAIPTSGSNGVGSGGSASYTVGQMGYTTINSGSGTVEQGVQQAYEISVVTDNPKAKGIELACSVYPNPTSDFLLLKLESIEMKNLSYQLMDAKGILLENKKISVNRTNIAMSNLVPSAYFLKVMQNNKLIKTFKIIKK